MEIVFEASHTHLYPGHEGGVTGLEEAPGADPQTCRIEFVGGGTALGTLTRLSGGDDWELEVDRYATAAGTDIPAKRWRIALLPDERSNTRFRVKERLAG